MKYRVIFQLVHDGEPGLTLELNSGATVLKPVYVFKPNTEASWVCLIRHFCLNACVRSHWPKSIQLHKQDFYIGIRAR